jgi:hypothetical protein
MDQTQNGLNSEWTELRMDSTPNGLNPDWTQPRLGLNPEWTELTEWDSTSNFYQPRIVQFQGLYQNNGFKKRIL